jgi:membrane protein
MLGYFRVPLGWFDLVKRTINEALADDVFNLAAQQAYYFFFALFPALLFVIGIASFFPLQTLSGDVVNMLGRVAPQIVTGIIVQAMQSLGKQNSGGVLTFGFLVTIWSTSGAMTAIITTLNACYDVTESRPWWKTRVIAILLTVGIAVFIIASMFLVIAGPTLAEHLATRFGLGPAFKWAWWVLQWPVVFTLGATAIGLIYYFAPDVEQDWVWITPGSVVATLLWLTISIGLKLYYRFVPSAANPTYGAIGGIMVLLLWFYTSGIAMLLGAELNSEIEHASPYGKDPGERVPGEKKVVGRRAQRYYDEKRAKGEIPIKPIPEGVNCDIDQGRVRRGSDLEDTTKPSDLIIGAIALVPAAIVAGKRVRNAFAKELAKRAVDKLRKSA